MQRLDCSARLPDSAYRFKNQVALALSFAAFMMQMLFHMVKPLLDTVAAAVECAIFLYKLAKVVAFFVAKADRCSLIEFCFVC